MGKLKSQGRPFDIPKREVWEAFQQVKENRGAPGVDGQTIEDFEADLQGNLYKIWNRMSSGDLLSATGASGGDREAAWRWHQDVRHT